MQRLTIQKFGPIEECEIEITDFMVLAGPQASGKSTVAKSIFFFNNIKNLLFQLIRDERLNPEEDEVVELTLKQRLTREIRSNFLQIFGTTMAMNPLMRISYQYENGETIQIHLDNSFEQKNFAKIDIGEALQNQIDKLEEKLKADQDISLSEVKMIITRELFHNDLEVIYIPAGRSLITLLSSQINYLYSTMTDLQKRSIDYCTKNYLERILQLKPFFSGDFSQILREYKTTTDKKVDSKLLKEAILLNQKILKGNYQSINGEDRLQLTQNHYVKINYASSGQQEAVWILNVLFYYMLNGIKSLFIIEEPESHLFPDAQKWMMEYIALAGNYNNQIVMTTHSPYVLGTINNLLFANKISLIVDHADVDKIVSECCWMSFAHLGAYYLEGGKANSCSDPEYENIQNDIIDGASEEINNSFERMVELEETASGGERT